MKAEFKGTTRSAVKHCPSQQAHNVKSDSTDLDAIERELGGDENSNKEYTSQVVDAYLAKVNLIDSRTFTKTWYLDLRASNHFTGDSSVFSSISSSLGTKIISAGGHSHVVTGIGNVAICLSTGGIQKISHVLYSPGITKNLI